MKNNPASIKPGDPGTIMRHGRVARRMEDLDAGILKAIAAAEVPADYAYLDNLDLLEPQPVPAERLSHPYRL